MHIATATTGAAGIAFVKSLGATFVTDYKVKDIFAALPDNSVDIVYDNYGAEGTADKVCFVFSVSFAFHCWFSMLLFLLF